MTRLRLGFMGTPDFAVPALAALHAAGHDIVAVYCQPPKPAGRGQTLTPTPVHRWAEAHGLPVLTPKTLRDATAQAAFAAHRLDLAVVAAYGLILPRAVLTAPRLGCVNIHASLLPRWRGAAPIQRALLAGDTQTGITIMQMDEGLDTGAILAETAVPITAATTATELHDRLATLGAELIVPTITALAAGQLTPRPQPAAGVTYAAKLTRAEGQTDWQQPAETIARMTRALNPWPGVFLHMNGEPVKILAANAEAGVGGAGTLLDAQGVVACGAGALRLITVQRPNKVPVSGADFINGLRRRVGDRL